MVKDMYRFMCARDLNQQTVKQDKKQRTIDALKYKTKPVRIFKIEIWINILSFWAPYPTAYGKNEYPVILVNE